MPSVVWTEEARAALAGVREYVGQFSPLNAQRLSAKLLNATEALSSMPDRGRPVGGGRRELTVIWPDVIRYRITPDAVYILRIRHGATRASPDREGTV